METIKNPVNLFWLCTLLHLIADYTLQGCLTNLKQKSWWDEQLKKFAYQTNDTDKQHQIFKKYEYDYMAALYCHSFMWGILTFLPVLFIATPYAFSAVVFTNSVIHIIVDHMKANLYVINLCQDQLLHLLQIVVSVALVCYI